MHLSGFEYRCYGWSSLTLAFASWHPWAMMVYKWLHGEPMGPIAHPNLCWVFAGLGCICAYGAFNLFRWSVIYDRKLTEFYK